MSVLRAEAMYSATRRLAAAGTLALMAGGQASWAQEQQDQTGPLSLIPKGIMTAPEAAPEPPVVIDGEAGPGSPPSSGARKRIQGIEVNPLREPSPDAIGVVDGGSDGLGSEMWRGTPRSVAERLLRGLPTTMPSPEMHDLARRLLLSVAEPPTGPAAAEGRFLRLRVAQLTALGEVPALNRLLELVPQQYEDEPLARARVDSLLLVRDFDAACSAIRDRITENVGSVYWAKALIFCQITAGETDRAALGLSLLREQNALDDSVFSALALKATGMDVALPRPKTLTPLDLALLEITATRLTEDPLDPATGAVAFGAAQSAQVTPRYRARAAEWACARGILPGAALAAAYRGFSFPQDRIAAVRPQNENGATPEARALLYQAASAETMPAARAEILRVALDGADDREHYQAMVRALVPLVTTIEISPDLIWFAPTAGRALYATAHYEQANAWLNLGRQQAIVNPQANAAVAALWPYSRLAGGPALISEGDLRAWSALRQSGDGGDGHLSRGILSASLEALGEPDPLPWSAMSAPRQSGGLSPDSAKLTALLEASAAKRAAETVLLALIVLGEGGPAESDRTALSAVLSALTRIGLGPDARALAIEAALANGV